MVNFNSNSSSFFPYLTNVDPLSGLTLESSKKEVKKEQKTQPKLKRIVSDVADPLFKRAFNHIWNSKYYDERVFLTTNEKGQDKTIERMKKEPIIGKNTVMLALSGFCGLNLAAARGENHGQTLDYIIMFDRSARVQKFWKEMEKMMLCVSSKEEAYQAIVTTLRKKATSFWTDCTCEENCQTTAQDKAEDYIKHFTSEIHSGLSWLSTTKRYKIIERIFKEGHFKFKRIDFFEYKKIGLLSKAIKRLKLTVDLIYLSNIREYAEKKNLCLPNFYLSIAELQKCVTDRTFIVDTLPRVIDETVPPQQRIIQNIRSTHLEKSFPPSSPDLNQQFLYYPPEQVIVFLRANYCLPINSFLSLNPYLLPNQFLLQTRPLSQTHHSSQNLHLLQKLPLPASFNTIL